MRYRPVYIAQIEAFTFRKGERPSLRTPIEEQRKLALKVETYYQVVGRSIDTCGHKHRTEAAAEPCLRRIKKAWHQQRSQTARQAAIGWRVRRAFGWGQ